MYKCVIMRSHGITQSYWPSLADANKFVDKHLTELVVTGTIFAMAVYDADDKCVRLAIDNTTESF